MDCNVSICLYENCYRGNRTFIHCRDNVTTTIITNAIESIESTENTFYDASSYISSDELQELKDAIKNSVQLECEAHISIKTHPEPLQRVFEKINSRHRNILKITCVNSPYDFFNKEYEYDKSIYSYYPVVMRVYNPPVDQRTLSQDMSLVSCHEVLDFNKHTSDPKCMYLVKNDPNKRIDPYDIRLNTKYICITGNTLSKYNDNIKDLVKEIRTQIYSKSHDTVNLINSLIKNEYIESEHVCENLFNYFRYILNSNNGYQWHSLTRLKAMFKRHLPDEYHFETSHNISVTYYNVPVLKEIKKASNGNLQIFQL